MVQEQAKSMLSMLIKDKKAFKKFYKRGYFSYTSEEGYKGEVAIVNNAIISFLEDAHDESKVVATANFQNSGTFIYKLFGEYYSFSRFGQDPTNGARAYICEKDAIAQDIDTIRKHCAEVKSKALAIQKVSSTVEKFSSILVQSDNKISSQEALSLLQGTADRLSQSRKLSEVENSDLDR